MKDAAIVAYGRSAIGKSGKGSLRYVRPDDLAAEVLKGTLEKIPELKWSDIDDIVMGCAFPEAEQGLNIGKAAAAIAGLPDEVCGMTVNRFCSSGLQAIAIAANSIMAGQQDVVIAGGVESMSIVPMFGNKYTPNPYLMKDKPEVNMSMGLTAENVAEKYLITRKMQDEFAAASHNKAAAAQISGKFDDDIIPVNGIRVHEEENGAMSTESFIFKKDEGIRYDSSIESLSKLMPAFKMNGTVTAGNSSQKSDGAAVVVLMSAEKAAELGIKPLAYFRAFSVAGVPAELMGIGPIKAIPKALKKAGITKEELELIELNEAFASQALACINELDLNRDIVNVNGGAIALGHPLGCTGAILTIKLISEMRRRKSRYGLVSMCIAGGMGAAAVFENQANL